MYLGGLAGDNVTTFGDNNLSMQALQAIITSNASLPMPQAFDAIATQIGQYNTGLLYVAQAVNNVYGTKYNAYDISNFISNRTVYFGGNPPSGPLDRTKSPDYVSPGVLPSDYNANAGTKGSQTTVTSTQSANAVPSSVAADTATYSANGSAYTAAQLWPQFVQTMQGGANQYPAADFWNNYAAYNWPLSLACEMFNAYYSMNPPYTQTDIAYFASMNQYPDGRNYAPTGWTPPSSAQSGLPTPTDTGIQALLSNPVYLIGGAAALFLLFR